MAPLVVDIYHGNPVSSFEQVQAYGIVGIIHKASQGGRSYDHEYATRRKQALNAGLLWGAYHFLDLSASAEAQVAHFASVAEVDDNTLIALDWESLGGRTPSITMARSFLEAIESTFGRKAVVYSGNVAKEQIKGNDEYFGSHRLWLAQYGTRCEVQNSWDAPWLWQNNGDAHGPGPHYIPGLYGLVDNSTIIAPMTVDLLVSQWSGVDTTTTPNNDNEETPQVVS